MFFFRADIHRKPSLVTSSRSVGQWAPPGLVVTSPGFSIHRCHALPYIPQHPSTPAPAHARPRGKKTQSKASKPVVSQPVRLLCSPPKHRHPSKSRNDARRATLRRKTTLLASSRPASPRRFTGTSTLSNHLHHPLIQILNPTGPISPTSRLAPLRGRYATHLRHGVRQSRARTRKMKKKNPRRSSPCVESSMHVMFGHDQQAKAMVYFFLLFLLP